VPRQRRIVRDRIGSRPHCPLEVLDELLDPAGEPLELGRARRAAILRSLARSQDRGDAAGERLVDTASEEVLRDVTVRQRRALDVQEVTNELSERSRGGLGSFEPPARLLVGRDVRERFASTPRGPAAAAVGGVADQSFAIMTPAAPAVSAARSRKPTLPG
jgi:hypothetical protein